MLFGNIPVFVVRLADADGMVHVALGEKAIGFRCFVELQDIVRSDMGLVQDVRNTICKYRIGIGIAVAVFRLVLVGEVDHRKDVGCVA